MARGASDLQLPLIEEPGKIYAPVADVMNGLGGTVEKKGDFVTVSYNGASVTLPVTSVSGTDYVSLRALFGGLNQSVVWCQASRMVSTSAIL